MLAALGRDAQLCLSVGADIGALMCPRGLACLPSRFGVLASASWRPTQAAAEADGGVGSSRSPSIMNHSGKPRGGALEQSFFPDLLFFPTNIQFVQ